LAVESGTAPAIALKWTCVLEPLIGGLSRREPWSSPVNDYGASTDVMNGT
jgi:hypothetical protein